MLRNVGTVVQFSLAKLTTSLDLVPSPRCGIYSDLLRDTKIRERFELFENIKPLLLFYLLYVMQQ